MPDDKMTSLPGPHGSDHTQLPAAYGTHPVGPHDPDAYYPAYESEPPGLDWRRYARLPLRYKWLLIGALLLGGAASYVVWQVTPVEYRAEGALWIDGEGGNARGDVSPIRPSSLLAGNSWVQLLRSYVVLDSVVVEQKLYLGSPDEFEVAFSTFALAERSASGEYELRISEEGEEYVLSTSEGVTVEEGLLGGPIGISLGYDWTPPPGSLPPGSVVPFTVETPRQAAAGLARRLGTRMDLDGNFLLVELEGTDPEEITATVQALMDRHVKVAAEIKRARLVETQAILEEQLRYTEQELASAEQALEEWRVRTITLPSDEAAIAPGLEMTRNPVFSNFFEMRVEVEQIRRDRQRLQELLEDIEETGTVRIEALELVQSAANSSELTRTLDELVDIRSEVRVLRDRYDDSYPPLAELLVQMQTIETNTVPSIVRGIIEALREAERSTETRIATASTELQEIPPRTIEEGRLERRAQIVENLYEDLRSRVETARLAAASAIPDVRILDEPRVPQEPIQDERVRLAIIIVLGCLGAALGGAVVLDQTDAKFRYATDVSREIGLDILGSIPRIDSAGRDRGVLNAAQALEAFRELRIHVGFAYGSAGPITLTITSPSAGEGKSLISSNLAVAFAEVGRRTLLIDGDTRRGDAHRLFALDQSPGLIDYLKGQSDQDIVQKTAHDNLDFIACGSRGTSTPELLASSQMARFLGGLKQRYEVIIVDSPPLASGGDPLILSTLTGNLAVVIRTGATEKQLTQAKLEQLSGLPIRILGAILNDVDPKQGYDYYYTAYLPGYQPVPEEDDEEMQLLSESS